MTLPARIDLGDHTGSWLWSPVHPSQNAVPAGLVIDHGTHNVLVPWANTPDATYPALFTLESLIPLTISEPVTCGTCGVSGRIREGQWTEAARG